ncbi:MAG: hypothetical protein R2939_18665 [Kofleriaceae bacterium]
MQRSSMVMAAVVAAAVAAPTAAHAFCGFYVSGSGDALYNDATQVVLMREGRTVLSMQNDYKGRPRRSRWWCRCRWSCRRIRSRPSPRTLRQGRPDGVAAAGRVLGAGSVRSGAGLRRHGAGGGQHGEDVHGGERGCRA